MKTNIGDTDRLVRIALGIVLILVAFLAGWTGLGKWLGVIAGLVLIGTAMLRSCPAYSILGLSTCKRK